MFRSIPSLSGVACLLFLSLPVPAGAQSILPGEVFSSLAVHPISDPNPVLGADGRVHLVYELMVDNPGHGFVTIDKVESIDAAGVSLGAVEGDALRAMTTFWADGPAGTIPPGGSATVFLDVTFAPDAALPEQVLSRISITRQAVGPDGAPAPMPEGGLAPAQATFTASTPATVGAPAVVIDAPLAGSGWVAVNGCCNAITSHRGAILAIDGALRVPERFAIDWIQLDASERIFEGAAGDLDDYPYYGTPALAVADGVVVNVYDEADEQTPGEAREGLTLPGFGGNIVVVDIGGGNYAFYAHLQKGSLKVGLGDTVTTGQELALLGNTGNSDAPHLHFHVMDGISPLDSNGLPYVFRSFTGQGMLSPSNDDATFDAGGPMKIDAGLEGPHVDALPLNNQIVSFD